MASSRSFLGMEGLTTGLVEVKKEDPEDWLEQEFGMDHENALRGPSSVAPSNISSFNGSMDDGRAVNQPSTLSDETDSFFLPVHLFQSMLNCVLCGVCSQGQVKIKCKDSVKYPNKFIIFCGACKATLFV